jgi:hydrogenase maturation protease
MEPATVVIGVGNPDRGDDGAGPAVASRLATTSSSVATIVRRYDPTSVVDDLARAETAYLVDAIRSGSEPGTVRRIEVGDVPIAAVGVRYSSHGLNVSEAIELARALGRLPRRLVVFGIEGKDFRIGAGLSPAVDEATRVIAERILDEIERS